MPFWLRQIPISRVCCFSTKQTNRGGTNWSCKNLVEAKIYEWYLNIFGLCQFL